MGSFGNFLFTLVLLIVCSAAILFGYRWALKPILTKYNVIPLRHFISDQIHNISSYASSNAPFSYRSTGINLPEDDEETRIAFGYTSDEHDQDQTLLTEQDVDRFLDDPEPIPYSDIEPLENTSSKPINKDTTKSTDNYAINSDDELNLPN